MVPVWAKITLAALALAREILLYMREVKSLSRKEQLTEIAALKTKVRVARSSKADLNIVV